MHYAHKIIRSLAIHYRKILILEKVNKLLGWDLNVNLPPKAGTARAEQIGMMTGIIADNWQDAGFRKNLESANEQREKLTEDERAMLRNINWQSNFYFRVPKELVVEFSETTSVAFMIWREARIHNEFNSFLPHLEKIIKLNQLIADHLTYKENRYDALLNLYEQGLTAKKCQAFFAPLRKELPLLIQKILHAKSYEKKPRFVGDNYHYPITRQKQLSLFILRKMGYDLDAGRMDVAPHPFMEDFARTDVRITTRYNVHDFRDSFTSAVHEGGHALYEQGIPEEYENTPFDGGVSLGIHESQSRFWENMVGRNPAFLRFLTPILQAFYPDELSDARPEHIVRLFNHVAPSLIRVESDEVTYNLHILLRFELEEQLIGGKLDAKDLPQAWREKMKTYLSVMPKTDREGALQDIHWSYGNFGYFPTYTLGNLNAAQFLSVLKKELPFDELLAKGEFGTILSWLRENIHQHGSRYWPDELMKRVTGETLKPEYFVKYLKEKYAKIYNISD